MNVLEILQTLLALCGTAMGSAEWGKMYLALLHATERHFSKPRFDLLCHDVDERHDAALTVCKRISKELPTWAAKSADECLKSFYRTCKNVYIEYWRKQKRRRDRGFSEVPTDDINTLRDQRQQAEATFAEKSTAQDFYEKFMPKLEQAKEYDLFEGNGVRKRQWDAWELSHLHDYTSADIAAKLDVSIDTVKKDIFTVDKRCSMWVLHEVEGLSHSEIAERVNADVAIVRKEAAYMRKHFGGLLR